MIEKRPHGGKILVTFTIPAGEGIESLHLVGDFNAWSETATPMSRRDDGKWGVSLELESGHEYQFRYRDQAGRWHNDETADFYLPNSFGSENSVISLVARPQSITGSDGKPARSPSKTQGGIAGRSQGGSSPRGNRRNGQNRNRKPGQSGPHAGPGKETRSGRSRRPHRGGKPGR